MEKLVEIVTYPWRLRQKRIEERTRESKRLYEESKRTQGEVKGLILSLMSLAEAAEASGNHVIENINDPEFGWPANTEIHVNFQSILTEGAPLISLSVGVPVYAEGEVDWRPYLTLAFKGDRIFHAHSREQLKKSKWREYYQRNYWQEILTETELSRWSRKEYAGKLSQYKKPETYLEDILGRMENIDEIHTLLQQSTSSKTPSNTGV